MGQGEREFTRRGEIHETRSKARNTARTGSTGRRRDQLSRFTRGDHARLASGGHRGQPSPSLGGKIWRAKAAPRGAGRGGRSLGRRRRVDARLGRNTPHVALDSTARDHPVREERARVSGERSHNPYCDLARETNRPIDSRLRAIERNPCGYPPQPASSKKLTTSQRSPDWFSTIGLTRGAAEAPSHAGSRPTRPSVRRRDIPRVFVRYRSASDRRHVEGHAGESPPMPATEVDPDFSPTNGSPSSTVDASCDWREPRVFEDRSGGTRAGARSFTQSIERPRRFCRHLRIVVASPPRFRRATRTGDRKSANPELLAILFFRPGARTPDRRPTNP